MEAVTEPVMDMQAILKGLCVYFEVTRFLFVLFFCCCCNSHFTRSQQRLGKATTLYVAVDLCMCENDAACPLSLVGL